MGGFDVMNEEKILLGINATMRSLMHQIDLLSRESVYKQNLKQRTENYYNYIEVLTNRIIFELDKEYEDKVEQKKVLKVRDQLVKLISKMDKLADSIVIK
jgi:hypothetical protein